MRILDDRKRLFGIVNPIDFIVIVAVLVGAIVVANVLFGVNPETVVRGRGNKDVEMVFIARGVRDFQTGDLAKDDKVTRNGGASVMGNVDSVRAEPAKDEGLTADMVPKMWTSSVKKDIYVTIRGKGDITPDGAFIGDEQVRVNMEMELLAPRYQTKGRVISVKVLSQ